MQVCDETDAEAVERRTEANNRHCAALHLYLMPRVCDSIGPAAYDRTHSARYQGIQRRAAGYQHSIMIMD